MKKSSIWDSLPKQPQQKEQLKLAIQKYMKKLQDSNSQSNASNIEKLKLRLKLIDKCNQLSLTRLEHLEKIFKHYCTHIFKTGKHMTFDRLEYEKVHLTMDRFFLLLRDFKLTIMQVQGKPRDFIDKNTIILIFKKVSSNAKDLTFQEFITCLQKLAIIYWDEKQDYFPKLERLKQEKKKRKEDYQRKKNKKTQKLKQKQQDEGAQQKSKQEEQEGQHKQQEQHQQHQQEKKQQNDDLVKDMMNDSQLQDPNQQVQKMINDKQQTPNWENHQQQRKKESLFKITDDTILLTFTKNEKIQYLYQLIGVDSQSQFKSKMCQLNLPIYNHYSVSANESKRKRMNSSAMGKIQDLQSSKKLQKSMQEPQNLQRMQALKEKMNEKKIKQKNSPIPKPKNNEQIARMNQDRKKKMQIKKERMEKVKKNKEESDAVLQKKLDMKRIPFGNDKKAVQFDEREVNWNVMRIGIEQLKLKQFQPQKYFHAEDEDRIFLQQYGVQELSRGRGSIDLRDRKSSASVVEGLKKRVNQVAQTQRNNQKKLNKISNKLGQNQLIRNKF